ncbi:hypothetical protein COO60DRAFT_148527 [Scenedesmus sp. NREL 46B-D3]|nr:hypothetical protein COO60DRAFT_148527 [Scenedesmus sp. NREL 46B-D3]
MSRMQAVGAPTWLPALVHAAWGGLVPSGAAPWCGATQRLLAVLRVLLLERLQAVVHASQGAVLVVSQDRCRWQKFGCGCGACSVSYTRR